MSKIATIALVEGSFDRGFLVVLEIADEGKKPSCKISGKLPPAPSIAIDYKKWQSAYRLLLDWSINSNKRAQLSEVLELSNRLSTGINDWLNSDPFRPIREKLQENLAANEELRVVIRSDNDIIQRLPWNCWDLCDRHPQVEIAVCDLHYNRVPLLPKTNCGGRPVRILAVFGNSTRINIQFDREIIKKLPNAEVCCLTHPKLHDINYRLSKQAWDIFFFAGHSYTEDNTGYLFINETDRVAIASLEAGLKEAISQGLKLAMFNSCDGIGLGKKMVEWQLPQALVMRDIVPDEVARVYLKSFMEAFSGGKSLYASVAEARSQLQELEDPFICASWLPVIFQNPAVPTTWDEFYRQK